MHAVLGGAVRALRFMSIVIDQEDWYPVPEGKPVNVRIGNSVKYHTIMRTPGESLETCQRRVQNKIDELKVRKSFRLLGTPPLAAASGSLARRCPREN